MEGVALKKQLFWYAIFHGVASVIGMIGVVALGSVDGMILFPLLSIGMVVSTLANRTRIQQGREVAIWPYTAYFWTNLIMTFLLVFQGFFGGLFWSIFRIVWTWKVIGWLKEYRNWVDQQKTDLI